jgi:E3 ubiquitin-protein ligase BRE1
MLLKSKSSRNNDNSSLLKFVKEALALRHSATVALMMTLQEAIAAQQARSESLSLALNGEKSNEGKKSSIVLYLRFSLHYTFNGC